MRLSSNDSPSTMLFIGLTTGQSASRAVFPAWMDLLGLPRVRLEGVDLPRNAPAEVYRAVVERMRRDPCVLGATITAHKIPLYESCADLFDELGPAAQDCGEISAIYKRGGRLLGETTDPAVAGAAMERYSPASHWKRTRGELLVFGAGGAATALLYHLSGLAAPASRPARAWVVDRDPRRLARLRGLIAARPAGPCWANFLCSQRPEINDRLVARLPAGSMVINATGMGKDTPGSPITGAALFPENGVAWDFNYRGTLDFLKQAHAQSQPRHLRAEDGWEYFLTGWKKAIELVMGVEIEGKRYQQFVEAAGRYRPQEPL
jgi:shikimate 5-dehydrogenase